MKNPSPITQHKLETGHRLEMVIEKTGLSLAKWAERYGRKKSNVGNWTQGRSYPDIQVLIQVCEDEGLTLDWFFRNILAGVSQSWVAYLKQSKLASQEAFQEQPVRVHENTS
jgi:transcriptional regulator with XRE-family HTH domain